MILLLFPLLTLQLSNDRHHTTAQKSLLLGLVISLLYALYQFFNIGVSSWSGQRIGSFWDIGRWAEILGYTIALLIPFLYESSLGLRKRLALISILMLSLTCLVLSGGRGPLLAVSISISIYLLLRSPKSLLFILVFILSIATLLSDNYFIIYITERIESIFNISSQLSNTSRIIMWEKGVDFIKYNASNSMESLLFGVGIDSFEHAYHSFLRTTDSYNLLVASGKFDFSLTDMHNTYLDLALKLGVLYAALFVLFLACLFWVFYRNRHLRPDFAYSGAVLVTTYSITAIFYTSGIEFQLTVFLSLVALCYSKILCCSEKKNEKP
ncbi:O-antigen ligase family protein [Vibrio sp. TBV020]|uniref:O-antigen ligase family protein n=1 Tax=Vibrio sp. TBV020 TaxID=3137398 RepID=UPI0038CD3409